MFYVLAVALVVAAALTEVQILLIAAVANAFIWLLRILLNKFGWQPPREILLVFIWITGVLMAIWFTPLTFPTGGFAVWAEFLTNQIGPIMALAWSVYQLIGKRIFDGIDNKVEVLRFRE